MIVAIVGMELLDSIDYVPLHDLHVVDIVEQLESLGSYSVAQFNTPRSVVAHIVGVVPLAVKLFHNHGDTVSLGDRGDPLESNRAIFKALLLTHSFAVSRKANHIRRAAVFGEWQSVFKKFDDSVVVFQSIQPALYPAGHAFSRGARKPVFFDGWIILHSKQIDGFNSDILRLLADFLEGLVPVAPLANGVVNVAFQAPFRFVVGCFNRDATCCCKGSARGHSL